MTPSVLAALAAGLAVLGAWEALGAVEELAVGRRLARAVAPLRLAGRTGREPTAVERRRLALLAVGALFAGGWLVAGPVAAVLLAVGAPGAVARVVAWRRARWRRALALTAAPVARALADALAGGHGIRGALTEAGRAGLPEPAATELAAAARRLDLGERTDVVLLSMRDRAADPAWDTIVAAILLQRETGGDLATLLRSIAATLEDARRVAGDAQTLTAQARATARIVAGLPLGGLVLGELLSPGTLAALLGHPLSALLVLGAGGLGAVAFVVVGRLARPPA